MMSLCRGACVCVSIHMCVHKHVHVYECNHECRSQRLTLGVSISLFSILLLDCLLSKRLENTDSARLAVQATSGVSLRHIYLHGAR